MNYTRERIYRKTEYIEKQKKNIKEDAYISVAPRIVSRVRRRESADPVFFFCFFFVRKKISQKMFFDSIIKLERVPTVFPQKSLIIFSSKREKSVEYRVRGTFPEKSFRRQVVKPEKSVEYRVRKFFQKNFSLKPQKSVEYRVRGLSLKKSSH